MSALAATAVLTTTTDSHNLSGVITVVVVALVIATAGYFIKCWLFPFTGCHHTSGRAWRCRRCQGTGMRLRAGRHLINRLRDIHRHR